MIKDLVTNTSVWCHCQLFNVMTSSNYPMSWNGYWQYTGLCVFPQNENEYLRTTVGSLQTAYSSNACECCLNY